MSTKPAPSACAELVTRIRERWKHDWPKIRVHKVGEKIYFMVDAGIVEGKRRRDVRRTLDEALDCARDWRDKRDKEGLDAMGLPSAVRADAARAWSKLDPHGITLAAAADYYLEHVVAYKNAPIVRNLVANLLVEKKAEKLRPSSLTALRLTLGRFAAAFGDRQLHSITLRELKEYFHRPEHSPRTQINTVVAVGGLYNYAKRESYVVENLCQRYRRPTAEETVVGILTVDQCAALLREAPRFKLLPYAVLGLFFGVRPKELERLNWAALKIEQKILVIGEGVAKKRRQRMIDDGDFPDAAIAFLAKHKRKRKGPIVSPVNLIKRFNAWRKAAGVEKWPHDAMRHSFGTYHFAAYGDDKRTSKILGHVGTDLLHNHYKALATKADGLAFFALRPTP